MATLKVTELGEFLREQRQGAKLSLRQLAEAAGVSNPYLSQVERGLRKPSAEVLQQIAKGLRISAEVLYVRAGILEEGAGRAEVETAVMADADLTERQRRVLLDIYASFRSENAREAEGDAEAAPTDQPAATTPRTTNRSTANRSTANRSTATSGTGARSTKAQAARRTSTGTKRTTPKKTTTNPKSTGGQ